VSVRLHFVVEGHAEEGFVNRVLKPHLAALGIYVDVTMVSTNRDLGRRGKGGIVNYAHLMNDLVDRIKEDQGPDARFTTMIDLYRLPDEFPGMAGARPRPAHEPIMSSVVRHMAKRDGDPVDRLVHSGLGASGRVNIRAWQSLDEGATWTGETVFNDGLAMYSVLSVLDDRSVGIVYEGYNTTEEAFGPAIFFVRFDVARLDKGVAASPAASEPQVPARR